MPACTVCGNVVSEENVFDCIACGGFSCPDCYDEEFQMCQLCAEQERSAYMDEDDVYFEREF